MDSVVSIKLLPINTEVYSSSDIVHSVLKKPVFTQNTSWQFFCHTKDGENNPYVIIKIPNELEINKLIFINRFGFDAEQIKCAEKIKNVKFATSNNGTNWREADVNLNDGHIYSGKPIEVSLISAEKYVKIYKNGDNCSAINLSQVCADLNILKLNRIATESFSKTYGLQLSATGEILERTTKAAIYHVKNTSATSETLIESNSKLNIDAVVISRLGRFGNAIIQLANAIKIAIALDVSKVIILDDAQKKLFFKKNSFSYKKIQVLASDSLLNDSNVLHGLFFYSTITHPVEEKKGKVKIPFNELVQFLDFNNNRPIPISTPVIHIRSGDIFDGTNVHSGYGQPPLSFYTLILKQFNFSRVILVFENSYNPVIDKLIEFCDSNYIAVECFSRSIRDDIEVIMNARFLICGHGTFVPIAASLGGNVEKIIFFERSPLFEGCSDVSNSVVIDSTGIYKNLILQKNWTNSASQRDLMITYSEDNLSFVENGRCFAEIAP